uniref:Uncharacterized protein n=1 Tax=Arundo donax TaxID=35708 RepID=A0A0A9AJ57_ARUDO
MHLRRLSFSSVSFKRDTGKCKFMRHI